MNKSGLVFASAFCLGFNIIMSLWNFNRGNIVLGIACIFAVVINTVTLYVLLKD